MRSSPLLRSPTIPTKPRILSASVSSSAAGWRRRFIVSARAITAPEPPWLVPSPASCSTSHGGLELACSDPDGRIPLSLRLVQLQKKSLSRRHRPDDPSALCPIGGAVWSFICLVEELYKSSVHVADEANQDRIFWDSTEPLIWLFLHVFSASPNLLPNILGLTASFVAGSVEQCVVDTVSSAFNRNMDSAVLASEKAGQRMASPGASAAVSMEESLYIGKQWIWEDNGTIDDPEKAELDSRRLNHSRRRSYYESMIVREKKPNSLILSNYAQFLYQVERDLERAQEYFKLALLAEPADAEASNKYAKFLWRERGDLAGAEEMFLEAIEMDPASSYHQSSYAGFLLLTGGDETCFPLDHGGGRS